MRTWPTSVQPSKAGQPQRRAPLPTSPAGCSVVCGRRLSACALRVAQRLHVRVYHEYYSQPTFAQLPPTQKQEPHVFEPKPPLMGMTPPETPIVGYTPPPRTPPTVYTVAPSTLAEIKRDVKENEEE